MSIPNTCLSLNLDALVAVKQKMLKACIRASRQTLRTPDHLLCLKYYIWVESIFLKFQVTPSAIQNNIVLAKKKRRGPQTWLGIVYDNIYLAKDALK